MIPVVDVEVAEVPHGGVLCLSWFVVPIVTGPGVEFCRDDFTTHVTSVTGEPVTKPMQNERLHVYAGFAVTMTR